MTVLTRRRLLAISAAALGLPGRAALATQARWQGQALGAHASLQLMHLSQAEAAPIIATVEAELARLEAIFSLYRADSAVSRLNRIGYLSAPPPELLEVLSLSAAVHALTDGLFDPTVQPLFAAYAEAATIGRSPSEKLESARALVGMSGVAADTDAIRMCPGMALTLNGIAQGYVTDRIAALLHAAGLRDVLVDMGEIAARGNGPTGEGWQVGITATSRRVTLLDHAIATSAALGTVIDAEGAIGHILHPQLGWTAPQHRQVSVIADTAALADALSTAAVLMSGTRLGDLKGPDIRILTT